MLSRLELQSAVMKRRHAQIAQLVGEIILLDNRAVPAIYGLIGVATCMTRHLSLGQRAQVVARLEHEMKGLVGPLN